jgi:chromosome partitioning protein
MKTIVVAAAKGGSGKSTIASALAARASKESLRVAMMDLNSDQGSLTQWWMLRGQPMNPRLITDIKNIPEDVKVLKAAKFEWLILDSPPVEMDLIEQAIAVSDFVLIPIRTSLFDVSVIDAVVSMCRSHRRAFAFVLSAVDSKFKTLTDQTVAALVKEGPLLASRVSYRKPYIEALMAGKTGPEINKDLLPEIDALWTEVKRLVTEATR